MYAALTSAKPLRLIPVPLPPILVRLHSSALSTTFSHVLTTTAAAATASLIAVVPSEQAMLPVLVGAIGAETSLDLHTVTMSSSSSRMGETLARRSRS